MAANFAELPELLRRERRSDTQHVHYNGRYRGQSGSYADTVNV